MGGVGSKERMFIALAILGALALGVWWTMEPGKYRSLTWILLGFFAFRVLIARARSGYIEGKRQND